MYELPHLHRAAEVAFFTPHLVAPVTVQRCTVDNGGYKYSYGKYTFSIK